MANAAGANDIAEFVRDYVERNRRAIALVGDNVFYFGELGMQEFETMGLLTGVLEQGGFKVELLGDVRFVPLLDGVAREL